MAADEAEAEAAVTIPSLISNLRTSFLSADFALAERTLLAREADLKQEIENLKAEKAMLAEKNLFEELERRRAETELEEYKASFELMKRKNMEMEELLRAQCEGLEGRVVKMEEDAVKLTSGDGLGAEIGGVVVKLEKEEVEFSGLAGLILNAGSSVVGEGLSLSGTQKISSGDADLIIANGPREAETLCKKDISEMHEDTGSLGLAGLERLGMLKRKPASTLNGSNDEKSGDKIKNYINSNGEKNQRLKLGLEAYSSAIKHATEIVGFSANDPYSSLSSSSDSSDSDDEYSIIPTLNLCQKPK